MLDYEAVIREKNAPGTGTTRFPIFRSLSTINAIELPTRLSTVRRSLRSNTNCLRQLIPGAAAVLRMHGCWMGLRTFQRCDFFGEDGGDCCYDAEGDNAEDAEDYNNRGGSELSVGKLLRETLVMEGGEPVMTHIIVSDPSDVEATTMIEPDDELGNIDVDDGAAKVAGGAVVIVRMTVKRTVGED